MHSSNQTYRSRFSNLTDRQRTILRLVVKSFINTAGPIGSRFLTNQFSLGLSSATIRNTLSDLEARGYLDHPYTSAGRIPTELGYRTFVDELMENVELLPAEKLLLQANLDGLLEDTEELLRESSKVLGRLTNLLGVVLSPRLSTGVLERLEVVPLSSSRVMFVISVRGGLLRTIIMHVNTDLDRNALNRVVMHLNERLAGLTLDEIRKTYEPRLRDLRDEQTGIVQLLMDEPDQLFSELSEDRKVAYGGQPHILTQPEFKEPGDFRNLIELMDDEDAMIQLLEAEQDKANRSEGSASITIGSENSKEGIEAQKVLRYSIVTAPYQRSGTKGTIGIIGPTRMDYARVVAMVEAMATLLSWPHDGPSS